VTDKANQYARKAEGWSDREYADPGVYLERRADQVIALGHQLHAGDVVLDLACGDGGLGAALLERGLRYRGIDSEPAMVAAANRRLGEDAVVEVGDLNTFEPSEPVTATTVFRALYYASDRSAFFARARAFTSGKLVFDLNPRQVALRTVVTELHEAGFEDVAVRPFFVPQTARVGRPLIGALRLAEQSGPLARLVLRARFTYVVAAS
jgi:predicted TPR repeat methyltransferase